MVIKLLCFEMLGLFFVLKYLLAYEKIFMFATIKKHIEFFIMQ